MIKYTKVLRSDLWSLQHNRKLELGEVVEMDTDQVSQKVFDEGMLEVMPEGYEPGQMLLFEGIIEKPPLLEAGEFEET